VVAARAQPDKAQKKLAVYEKKTGKGSMLNIHIIEALQTMMDIILGLVLVT